MLLAPTCAFAAEAGYPLWGNLQAGPQSVGFRLIDVVDASRVYPRQKSDAPTVWEPRRLRAYVWYPTQDASAPAVTLRRFAQMAAEDFALIETGQDVPLSSPPLPVPLAQGVKPSALATLIDTSTASHLDAPTAPGRFPVVVLGQGLYYESPLSQLVLSEYLASWGYVVVTCPLKGTHYRLVNLNVADLETVTRDLECVFGRLLAESGADPGTVGVVGYDMGGMAGMILAMRSPLVSAFVSLDAGILDRHFSGLPRTHPDYDLARLSVPWLHMTQARFVEASRRAGGEPSAMEARKFGDNYLLSIHTTNHGSFSSYAMFGIENALPGYWEAIDTDPKPAYEAVCLTTRRFLDAYLKHSQDAIQWLDQSPAEWQLADVVTDVQRRPGPQTPTHEEPWIHRMIRDGVDKTLPALRTAQLEHPDVQLVSEQELNWLGYHLLVWWGRPAEAVPVLQLLVELFPNSANGVDSLAEAYLVTGNRAEAIRYYRKAIEMNPDNQNARAALTQLLKENHP
jgi:tetratricopeptide (TPR) repeat protein